MKLAPGFNKVGSDSMHPDEEQVLVHNSSPYPVLVGGRALAPGQRGWVWPSDLQRARDLNPGALKTVEA